MGETSELKNIIHYAKNKILLIESYQKDSILYKASDIKLLLKVNEAEGIVPTAVQHLN